MLIGGMPEAIRTYTITNNLGDADKILDTFANTNQI